MCVLRAHGFLSILVGFPACAEALPRVCRVLCVCLPPHALGAFLSFRALGRVLKERSWRAAVTWLVLSLSLQAYVYRFAPKTAEAKKLAKDLKKKGKKGADPLLQAFR